MDENLPKYYSSTTDAYLKMKPPHGVFRLNDFARFMRSIGIDLTNDNVILKELFAEYDKNKNGHLDAWEFIACFGPSINGHSYSSTSLKFGDDKKHKKQSRELLEKPLDATQTRAIIAERLPLHYKSSTKAFLAAKGGVNKRSNVIMFPDFKLWLQNMNIIVPDQTVRDLFAYLDTDGSGQVSCAEFIECFGHAISGEQSKNIQDAEHLSFHNTRPDQRVAVVPKKHQWTYDEVMRCLGERMGLIHTSSTKAFMRAKRCGKTTMDYEDLNRALLNLNIDAPEKVK
jgi:Ca2+-binding EF-hand superfamily protein